MATGVSKIDLVQNATHFTIGTLFLSINNLSSSSFCLLKGVFRFFPSGISGILPAVISLYYRAVYLFLFLGMSEMLRANHTFC